MYLRWNPENHAGETPPDMRAMVLSYFKDCAETKQTRSRWILRLFPSQVVCFAGLEDIRAAAAALIKSELPDVVRFESPPSSFTEYRSLELCREN